MASVRHTAVRTRAERRRLRLGGGELAAFAIAFAAAFAIALAAGFKPFPYDSLAYWNLGEGFEQHGHWSLLGFSNELRGYLLGLVYGGLHGLADDFGVYGSGLVKAFNALLVAAIGTVLLPRLAAVAWPSLRFGLVRRLVIVAIFVVFWRGYLNYPLSDLPALTAALTALVAVSGRRVTVAMPLAGFAAALAILMRPAYLLLLPAVILLALWPGRDRAAGRRGRVLAVALVVVGMIVPFVPQSVSAHRNFGTWSPIPGAAARLTDFQLTEGLKLQRYETYIGGDRAGPTMYYLDPHTQEIAAGLGGDGLVDGYGDYLRIVTHHPVTMAGVFGRHVVNGLDQRYSTPYVEHLDTGQQRPFRVAEMLLIYLGLVRVLWPAARRGLGPARWRYPGALAVTCLTSLPSAMETRFLLPVFALCCLLVVAPGWPRWLGLRASADGARRFVAPAAILVGVVAYMALMWSVASAASDHLVFS